MKEQKEGEAKSREGNPSFSQNSSNEYQQDLFLKLQQKRHHQVSCFYFPLVNDSCTPTDKELTGYWFELVTGLGRLDPAQPIWLG